MSTVSNIVIKVELHSKKKRIAQAECHIPLSPGEIIRADCLVDACQRSVSHCIDELQDKLDIDR